MAIAFDAVTVDASSAGRTGPSFAHTCTGTDLTIVVIPMILENFGAVRVSTAVSYNGVALTEQVAFSLDGAQADLGGKIWTLDSPATGSNTVAVTYDDAGVADAVIVMSFTGANNGVGDATGSANGTSDNPSATFTTDASTGLIVSGAFIRGGDAGPFTPGTGVTERADGVTGGSATGDIAYTGGHKAATGGSDTIDFTGGASDNWIIGAVELNEAGGGPAPGIRSLRQLIGHGQGTRD